MSVEPRGCPMCSQTPLDPALIRGRCQDPAVISQIARQKPQWITGSGDCPACVQQALLETRLVRGLPAMRECLGQVWPIDSAAAFGALPTPLRLHSDPRFTGRGVTVAQIDSGFYPHPDLVDPVNRIRAWADATRPPVECRTWTPDQRPDWPGWDQGAHWQWHGLMTTAAAFGNGWMSHGLYSGIASEAELVLIQTWDRRGRISNRTLARALRWIRSKRKQLQIRIVSISVAGDPLEKLDGNFVDRAVRDLVEDGVVVIAASGNKGERRLVPPATAPEAITVGGLDDRNVLNREQHEIWHSNYDTIRQGVSKPEVVAPSLWVVAPVLPGSGVETEALELFERRQRGDDSVWPRMQALKLVTPHYQHVEGTSFAAPLIASIVACMLEANPALSPGDIKGLLARAAYKVPGAADERQGAGAVDAGLAVALALEAAGPPR